MRKLLTFFVTALLSLVVSSAFAQVSPGTVKVQNDITTKLNNPSFEADDPTEWGDAYDSTRGDGSSGGAWTIGTKTLTGWTLDAPSNTYDATFAVCDLMSSAAKATDNGYGAPGSPSEGKYMLYFRNAHASYEKVTDDDKTASVTQKVTLLPGTYMLTVDSKCFDNTSETGSVTLVAGEASQTITISTGSSNCLEDEDAEWVTTSVSFTLGEAKEIEIGVNVVYGGDDAMSLLIDNFKLYQEVDPIDVGTVVEECEAELSHWTTTENNGHFVVNTWSGEADASGMVVPFIENWVSNAVLGAATISHNTLADLPNGYYTVEMDIRIFSEAGNEIGTGTTFSANGTSEDLADKQDFGNDDTYGTETEVYGKYSVLAYVNESTLDISLVIPEGATYNWISFKNLSVTYLGAVPQLSMDLTVDMNYVVAATAQQAIEAFNNGWNTEDAHDLYVAAIKAIRDAEESAAQYAEVAALLAELNLDEAGQEAWAATTTGIKYNSHSLVVGDDCTADLVTAVKAQTTEGSDMTYAAINSGDWKEDFASNTGQFYATGDGDGWQHYSNEIDASSYPVKVLYKQITGLQPGVYEVSFYGVANNAWVGAAVGDGIAQVFANDAAEDVTVYDQTSCTVSDYPHTLTCTVGTDGTLEYGLQNIAKGGNWYVAQTISLTYVSEPVGPSHYTFVNTDWVGVDGRSAAEGQVTYSEDGSNTITVNASGSNNAALFNGTQDAITTENYYINSDETWFVVVASDVAYEKADSYLWWMNGANNGGNVAPDVVVALNSDNSKLLFAWDLASDGMDSDLTVDEDGNIMLDGWTGFGLTAANETAVISDINFYSWEEAVELYPQLANISDDDEYTIGDVVSSADLDLDDEREYTVVSNNLFVNGGFNDGPNGWTAGGYETPATPDDADFVEGNGFNNLNYVETNGGGASSNKTLSQAVAVEVGKTYLFVGYTSGTTPGEDNLRYNALFQMDSATHEVGHDEDDGKSYSNDIIRMKWGAAAGSGTSAGSRIEPDGTPDTWTRTIGVFTAEYPYVGMRMGWNSKSCFDAFQLYEVETAFIEDGEYLLVDSETGLYAGGGLDYGTKLTMLKEPQFFGFAYDKDELGYSVDSHQYNTADKHYLGMVSGNTTNPWTDSDEQYWKVNSEGHGGYTLSITQGTDTYYLVAGAKAQDAVALSIDADEATVWNFVTREDVIATMDEATNDNPVDVTALIAAPELKRYTNTANYQTWEQEGTVNFGYNNTNAANCAEAYHDAFEVKQTLTDLKPGTYKLSAQGFYRIDTAAEEEIPAVLFTSASGIAEMMNVYDAEGVTSAKADAPSTMTMADAYADFLTGLYPVENEFVVAEGEDEVEIGISGSDMDGRWVIFGELNLLYYGPATEPVLVHEEEAEFAHWTIEATNEDEVMVGEFALNTWSTEADPSGMVTPFIQYWAGTGINLSDVTISHTQLTDLKAGYYVVSIDARAFNEKSLDNIKAGIVLSANGTSVDLSLGTEDVYDEVSAEVYGTYEVPCMVGEDGTLDISFTLTDVNCDWLAFKNLTVTYYPDPSEILPDATTITAVTGDMSTACEEAMEAAIAAYEAAQTAENAVALYQALADAQLCANFYASVADALAQLEEYLDEDGLAALEADENIAAYEDKTLEPCNMLDTYMGAVKAQTTTGVDLTMVLLDTEWIGQTGTYSTGVERYGDEIEVDGDEPVKVLYQHIEGLVPGVTYDLTFYAVANNAWVGAAVGDGIAQVFANDEVVDVTVYDQTAVADLSIYSYTFSVTVGSDGVLEYGLQNIATGGNWYLAQAVSLTIANNSDDEYKVGDEAVVEGKSYTVVGENLFANGGFNQTVGADDVIPGWTQGNGEINYVASAKVSENTTITTSGGYNGLAYLTTNGAGASDAKTLTQAVAVVPGKQYLFVGYTSGTTPALENLRYNALFVMANDTVEANHLEDDGKTYSDEIIRLLWGPAPKESVTPDGTTDTWTRTAGVFTAISDYVGMRMGWNSSASFDAFQLYEVEGNEIEDGEYLIATTDADGNTLYIGGGLDYNTELTLLKKPQFFGIAYDEETGAYTIDSHQYRNEENHYMYETADGGVYTDGTVDATQWTIYPVKEEDEETGVMSIVGYTISDGTSYLAAGNVQEAVTLTTDPDETTTWTLITKEDVIASMSEAKHNNPVDATALIAAPEMKNYTNTTWWPTWNAPQSVSFGYNHPTETGANCAEAYRVAFEIDQTLEGLPVGNYKLMAQGFHRDDLSQESYITPVMFVDDAEADLLSIDSPVGADATFVTPDDMPTAYTAFLAENYPVEIDFAVTEEGQKVVIGFVGEDTNEWVCFGELTLLYYGEDTSVDLVAHECTADPEDPTAGIGINDARQYPAHWTGVDANGDVLPVGNFHVNGWSTEADESGMKTPFIEYWVGAGSDLEAATISHKTLVGLPEGNYEVSLDIRILNENGEKVEAGTLFKANGVSEDLVTGADSHDASFNGNDDVYGTYTLACEVGEEGTLDISIVIPDGVTYDWIAFKNLTVTLHADEMPEVEVYGDGAPMNAEVEAAMEAAVEAYTEAPTADGFTAAIDAIQDAAASIEVYEEIAALVEALDETGTEAWDATESATAFETGTLVSLDEIEEDMTTAQAAQTTAVTDWTYVLKYTGEWKHDELSSVMNFQICPSLDTAHEAWRNTTFGGSVDEPSMPLYKEIADLPAGVYEITFYAYAAQGDLGDVIVFANDSITTIEVDELSVGPNWSNVAEQITLTCTVGADGILDFGLKCIGAGAWYVAEEGTLTLLEVITEMPYEYVNSYWVATDLEANPESIVYNDGNTITVEGTTIGLGTRVLTTDRITTESMYVTEDQNLFIVVADDIDGAASLLRWTNGNDNEGLALAPDTVVTLLDGQVLVMWDITELEKAADAEGKIFLDGWTAFALTSTSGESTISDICFYDWDTAVETYPELGWDEDMRAIVERYIKDCDTANASIAALEEKLEEDPDDLDAQDQLEALTITMHGDGYSIAYGEYDIFTASYDDLYEACIVIENVLLATQITEVETATSAPEGIYTLDGVRVSKITKSGIYIVDGKKVLVK